MKQTVQLQNGAKKIFRYSKQEMKGLIVTMVPKDINWNVRVFGITPKDPDTPKHSGVQYLKTKNECIATIKTHKVVMQLLVHSDLNIKDFKENTGYEEDLKTIVINAFITACAKNKNDLGDLIDSHKVIMK